MKRFFAFGLFLISSFCLIGQETFLENEKASELPDDTPEYIIDTKGKLRKMEFQDEIFIPEKNGDKTVFIDKADKEISRSFFDSNNLLVRKEVWSIEDIHSARIIQTFEYKYSDNNICVYQKIKTESSETEVFSDEKGLLLKEQVYDLLENDKRKLKSDKNIKYDGMGNIIRIEIDSFPEKSPEKHEVYKFIYTKGQDISPDMEYYLNGALNIRRTVKNENEYTKEVFFDNDYVVKTEYKNGIKIHESYISNGKLLRENFYE